MGSLVFLARLAIYEDFVNYIFYDGSLLLSGAPRFNFPHPSLPSIHVGRDHLGRRPVRGFPSPYSGTCRLERSTTSSPHDNLAAQKTFDGAFQVSRFSLLAAKAQSGDII
jgi:hypothetical protein